MSNLGGCSDNLTCVLYASVYPFDLNIMPNKDQRRGKKNSLNLKLENP